MQRPTLPQAIALAMSLSTMAPIALALPNTWAERKNLHVDGRYGAVAFSIGTKGYVGTGNVHGTDRNDFWEYDPTSNVWTQKADYGGQPSQYAVGFAAGGKGYIGTGQENQLGWTDDFWEYDPTANTWTQKADFGGGARLYATAFAIGTKGYICTGTPGFGGLTDLWEYDTGTDTWTQKTSMPGPDRYWAAGVAVNGKGYVGTGVDANTYVMLNDWYEYDPGTDTWATKSSLPTLARSKCVTFAVGTKGYVATGHNSNGNLIQDLWEYETSTDTWTQRASFPGTGRHFAVGFGIGNYGYAGTGANTDYNNDLWRYDTVNDIWNPIPSLGRTGRYAAFSFGIGSFGYVGGGYDYVTAMNDLWQYDPSADVWTQKADLPGAGRLWSTGFTIDSLGYMCSGYTPSSIYHNDLWSYSPTTNTWTARTSIPSVGRYGAVSFVIAGYGYVSGGAENSILPDLWRYDPVTDSWTALSPCPGPPRFYAASFALGGYGYVGTGFTNQLVGRRKDFYRYDPVLDSWTQIADYAGTIRYGAIGFASINRGFVATGDNGFFNQEFYEYDPGTDSWLARPVMANYPDRNFACSFTASGRLFVFGGRGSGAYPLLEDLWEWDPLDCFGVPAGPTLPGTPCNDFNPNTLNDAYNANCFCTGTFCSDNVVNLTLNTDASASQTSWDIVNGGTNTVVCSGNGYANSSTINVACCLPNGCYDLRVFDSGGDGINPGGFVLRDAVNERIIDDANNGPNFSSLAVVTGTSNNVVSFCVPIGSDAMMASSCDQTGLTTNSVVRAVVNPAVSAQYGINNANSGYQFWVFKPDGGYSRRIFFSHSAPGAGWPGPAPVAERCSYFKLSAMSSSPAIPQNVLLNIRVRSRVNGVYAEFGPACRMAIGTPIVCSTTQLTTTATPLISCGATGLNRQTGVLWSNNVPGANKYQFEFVNASTLVLLRNIASPTRNLNMSTWGTSVALPNCFTPYNIRVRVSFNNGVSYCPWGPVCQVTFNCPPEQGRIMGSTAAEQGAISMWPNPNDGSELTVSLSGLGADTDHTDLVIFDAFGRPVMSQVDPVSNGEMKAVINLDHRLAAGLYLIRMTATDRSGQTGEREFTERLIIE